MLILYGLVRSVKYITLLNKNMKKLHCPLMYAKTI